MSRRTRYVVIGGGAVGGALAAQLVPVGPDRGFEVVLVARGKHGRVVAEHGLTVRRPDGVEVVEVTTVAGPEEVDLRVGDVLVLTVKTQDAEAALTQWAWQPVHDASGAVIGVAADLPIITFQNGLAAEDLAWRRFAQVYGATIAIAASYLTPGEIVSPSRPPTVGGIWLGRHGHPGAPDDLAENIVADLVAAGFAAWAVPDIAAHKAAKLLGNVGNGLDLFTGPDTSRETARALLVAEAKHVFAVAGIPLPTSGSLDWHGAAFAVEPVPGHQPGKLSTWQSFARGASSEIDYLNGEVVLLARRVGVSVPVNTRLQHLLGLATTGEVELTFAYLLAHTRDDIAV